MQEIYVLYFKKGTVFNILFVSNAVYAIFICLYQQY